MKPLRRHFAKTSNKGQAALEFLFCVVVVFFFLFFYLSLAVVMTTSEYLEYAAFMAARTYKSAKGDDINGGDFGVAAAEQNKRDDARTVFNAYAQGVQGIARNFNLQFNRLDPNDPQTSGVIVTYDMDLFYLPPVFLSRSFPSRIRLTTESYLGRDPNFNDTVKYFADFVRDNGIPDNGNPLSVIEEMDDTGF